MEVDHVRQISGWRQDVDETHPNRSDTGTATRPTSRLRVAFAGKTIVITAVGGTTAATGPHAHGLPSDGNLLGWRSTDGGATWSKAITINDSPASAREGLHALAADDDGNLTAVWLDLRSQGTRLYAASSKDDGMSWSPNFKLYESPEGTICQCCHPSLLALGRGQFAVMFRNVLGGNRDMYTLRFTSGKIISEPVKAGEGTWAINACPWMGAELPYQSPNGDGMAP